MTRRKKANKYKPRSKFEQRLMEWLDRRGVEYEYEKLTYPIEVPLPNSRCPHCDRTGTVAISRYTPDFFLPWRIVEAKGKFTPRDRKRVLALLAGHPHLKARFALLFMRDNWMTKKKERRYTDWCREHRIACAVGEFPEEWLK